MCSLCVLKKGRAYPIASPAMCTVCYYEFGAATRDMQYAGMYADTLHRFQLCNPVACPRCSHVTKIVLINCEAIAEKV
jgi:hypothetical protein